jgi:hypothetical protein
MVFTLPKSYKNPVSNISSNSPFAPLGCTGKMVLPNDLLVLWYNVLTQFCYMLCQNPDTITEDFWPFALRYMAWSGSTTVPYVVTNRNLPSNFLQDKHQHGPFLTSAFLAHLLMSSTNNSKMEIT